MKRVFFAALTGTAIPAFWLSRRYRRDINAARARLAAFERHVIATPRGQVEYTEQGTGAPVLPRKNETWSSRRTATAAQPHSDAISGSPNSSPSPGTHRIHSFCFFLRS